LYYTLKGLSRYLMHDKALHGNRIMFLTFIIIEITFYAGEYKET